MVELRVRLRPLTEEGLAELLEVAVADAEPAEVLAPVAGSPGWTAERRRAFLEFHRGRSVGTDHPVETTYVICVGDRVVGAARLEPAGEAVEAGVWIGRSHRGRGVGEAVMAHLRSAAVDTGASRLTASTTVANIAAQRLLAHAGAILACDGADVVATLDL